MTYCRLHYHLIWATFERQALLTQEREKIFYDVVARKANELDLIVHAAGNVEDHVHLCVSIPPKLSVAGCVKHIKGASAFAINRGNKGNEQFKWQEGYGALSIGERSLETVMAYVSRQKEHHKDLTVISGYEKIDDE